jgi:hypothetical protein
MTKALPGSADWPNGAFHFDPPTTLAKLRMFAEVLAKIVAARHALKILPRENFEILSPTHAA